jgi:hypothetical protein
MLNMCCLGTDGDVTEQLVELFFASLAHIGIGTNVFGVSGYCFFEYQSGRDGGPSLFRGGRFDGYEVARFLDGFRNDLQGVTGCQKVAKLDASDLSKQYQWRFEPITRLNQPYGSLMKGFQHHHAGHDRETGEVVLQIFLLGAQRPLGRQLLAWLQRGDTVDLAVFHLVSIRFSLLQ